MTNSSHIRASRFHRFATAAAIGAAVVVAALPHANAPVFLAKVVEPTPGGGCGNGSC